MSQFFSSVGSLFNKPSGGGPGNTATSASGDAANRSINVISGDGSLANLKQLIQVANGAPANGGYTGVLSPGVDYVAPTPENPADRPDYTPLIIVGIAVVGAIFLLRS